MTQTYDPSDPRYHDRFLAAMELVRLWRNLVQADADGINRVMLHDGHTLEQLVRWTDEFINHPLSDVPTDGEVAKT